MAAAENSTKRAVELNKKVDHSSVAEKEKENKRD